MRSNISHSSRFHDSPSSSFFLCYTGVISPCAVSRLLYNFQNILIHNWAKISQQEKRTISLWGEFALRRIRQVMQHYPLPPIHPDPSYHIPVTQPTTPHSCSTANRHAMSAPPLLSFVELEDISSDGKLTVCTGLLLKNENTHCFENSGISCPSRYNPSYCGFSLYLWHCHTGRFHLILFSCMKTCWHRTILMVSRGHKSACILICGSLVFFCQLFCPQFCDREGAWTAANIYNDRQLFLMTGPTSRRY